MKKLLSILVVVGLVYGGWRLWRGPAEVADSDRGQQLFYGRVWLDHLPSKRNEMFKVFGTAEAEPFGWYAERSGWRGEWEIFRYKPLGDGVVELLLPQSDRKLRTTYRAWKCNEQGFDYCLEITSDRPPSRFFSKRGWERRRLSEGQALVQELTATD